MPRFTTCVGASRISFTLLGSTTFPYLLIMCWSVNLLDTMDAHFIGYKLTHDYLYFNLLGSTTNPYLLIMCWSSNLFDAMDVHFVGYKHAHDYPYFSKHRANCLKCSVIVPNIVK